MEESIETEEKWIKWEPIEEIKGQFYVDAIINDLEGLKIELSNDNRKLNLLFKGFIASCRSTEEGYIQKTYYEISRDHDKLFFKNSPLFKVENSKYISWLLEESYEIYHENLIHFVILTYNFLIDVVTLEEPDIKLIEG